MILLKKSVAVMLTALMLASLFIVCTGAVPVEFDYTAVRGTLPGCDWDGTYDYLNTMSESDDGTCTITYNNVPKGDYEFKVISYDCWYGTEDYQPIAITVSEESDLTIRLEPDEFGNNAYKVVYSGEYVTKTKDSEINFVSVAGSFTDKVWDAGNSIRMKELQRRYYTLTLDNIEAGDYEYQFIANGTFYRKWGSQAGKEADLSGVGVYDSNLNFNLHVGENDKYVTFILDLRGFDFDAGKLNAFYAVTLSETEPFEPTVPEETTEPVETTSSPEETTEAVEATTAAPEETTEAVEATTAAPEETTEAVETTTAAPVETTEAVESTTAVPETTVPTVKPVVKKKANPIKVTVKTKTVKLKKLRKKAQKVKPFTVKNSVGKLSFKLVKSGITQKIRKYVKINSKGVITLKKWKKAKKGTYKIKVKITAKGNASYNAKTLTKTVKVKIK